MRVLLDMDLLLDVALWRAQLFSHSAAVLQWAEAHPGQAAVAGHSLANLSYVLRPDAARVVAWINRSDAALCGRAKKTPPFG